MADPGIEIYYEDGRWKNRPQGNSRATSTHDTKAEATKAGKDMARKRETEHIIKNMDGKIGKGSGSRQSYGNDPNPPKG